MQHGKAVQMKSVTQAHTHTGVYLHTFLPVDYRTL